jgi:hypothetical protein
MKPDEIVLRRQVGEEGEQWRGQIQLRHTVRTYVNITMYPPVQILYANKIINKKENFFFRFLGEGGREK